MEEIAQITVEALKEKIRPFPIAYFCAEFALGDELPIFAGGLGVLAGDVLREACDQQMSFIGVGLFYQQGYVRQEISKEANIVTQENIDLKKAGLKIVTKEGQPLMVTVPIHDRQTKVRVMVKEVGACVLLLLDTKVDENDAHDKSITDNLYVGDREHRFEQEMILGIGGHRALEALGIVPRFYHLNEGHSALLFYELARAKCEKDKNLSFSDAIKNIGNVVFTNHTLVPAGHDVFSQDLALSYLEPYCEQIPFDPAQLVSYGVIEDSSLFSPTMLALRLATTTQAVSKLHATKALEVWAHHPMIAVTNGIHRRFWQSQEIASCDSANTNALWMAHLARKKKLLEYIKQTTQIEWNENDFIVAWSRRMVKYKRPLTLLEDFDRLRSLFGTTPLKIVISGKPHAGDEMGQEQLAAVLSAVGQFEGKIVYLQNYSLSLAGLILSGIDLLVNTPVRGFEACGTSGMKSGINGVLQATTLDGWTDEVDWTNLGWVLDAQKPANDLYNKLEKEIIPLFLNREKDLPQKWIGRMQKMIGIIEDRYTTTRMMKELQDMIYTNIRADNPPRQKL